MMKQNVMNWLLTCILMSIALVVCSCSSDEPTNGSANGLSVKKKLQKIEISNSTRVIGGYDNFEYDSKGRILSYRRYYLSKEQEVTSEDTFSFEYATNSIFFSKGRTYYLEDGLVTRASGGETWEFSYDNSLLSDAAWTMSGVISSSAIFNWSEDGNLLSSDHTYGRTKYYYGDQSAVCPVFIPNDDPYCLIDAVEGCNEIAFLEYMGYFGKFPCSYLPTKIEKYRTSGSLYYEMTYSYVLDSDKYISEIQATEDSSSTNTYRFEWSK
jgi:hypothetical protein